MDANWYQIVPFWRVLEKKHAIQEVSITSLKPKLHGLIFWIYAGVKWAH